MAAAANGDAVVAGRAHNGDLLDDMIVMRLAAADGGYVWVEHYDGVGNNDRAYDLLVRADGNVAFTGVSLNADETADFQTYLVNGADGHEIWSRREPGAVNNENRAGWLGEAAGGDLILANRTWVSGNSYDVVLQRYAAADGEPVWTTTYDHANGADDIRDMILDADGQPVVVGVSGGDMMTLRFDAADGGLLWDAFHDGPMGWYDLANCVAQGPEGLLLTAGFSDGGSSTWDATVVAHRQETGEEAWTVTWDGAESLTDELRTLAPGAGGFYAVGYSYAASSEMDLLALSYRFAPTSAPGVGFAAGDLSAWPNPFRSETRLSLSLASGGSYRAEVYDAQGRRVRALAAGHAAAGELPLAWDGRDDAGRPAPAGVYLVRVAGEAGEYRGRLLKLR